MSEVKLLLLLLLAATIIAGILLWSAFYTLRQVRGNRNKLGGKPLPLYQEWMRDLMRH